MITIKMLKMKSFYLPVYGLILFVFLFSCKTDESFIFEYCDLPIVSNEINISGEIKKYTIDEHEFLYIGNPLSRFGGYIPCNPLPVKFQKEGLLINYSGHVNEPLPGTDPLFVGISLYEIELVEQ